MTSRKLIFSFEVEIDGPSPSINSMIQFDISVIDAETCTEVSSFKRNIGEKNGIDTIPVDVTNVEIKDTILKKFGVNCVNLIKYCSTMARITWDGFWSNLGKFVTIHETVDCEAHEFAPQFFKMV